MAVACASTPTAAIAAAVVISTVAGTICAIPRALMILAARLMAMARAVLGALLSMCALIHVARIAAVVPRSRAALALSRSRPATWLTEGWTRPTRYFRITSVSTK